MAGWQTKSSKVVYENPWMIVHEDIVTRPNGNEGMYGYVTSKSDSVIIVPVDDEGYTYLVQQKRYTKPKPSWETPAGRTDGEPYEQAAARELLEETGYRANKVTLLSEIHMSSGLTNFKSGVCIATDLEYITDQLDQDDGILGVRRIALSELKQLIVTGEINSGSTVSAVLLVIAYLESQGKA